MLKKEPVQVKIIKFEPIKIKTNYPKDYFLFEGEVVELILPPIIIASKLVGRKEDVKLPDLKIKIRIIRGHEQNLETFISQWLFSVIDDLKTHWEKRKTEIETGLQIPEKKNIFSLGLT